MVQLVRIIEPPQRHAGERHVVVQPAEQLRLGARNALVDRCRLFEQPQRALVFPEGVASRRSVRVRRAGADGAAEAELADEPKRLVNLEERLVFVARFAEMTDHLVAHHQLAALVADGERLLEPIAQMPLDPVVIATAHVLVELLDDPLLRNAPCWQGVHPVLNR